MRWIGTAPFLALSFVATCCSAQVPVCASQEVAVTVLNDKRSLITDLRAADFRAKVGGKPVDVTAARMASKVPWTVLVLDSSGSMLQSEEWRATLRYATGLINSAPARERIALVVFATRVTSAVGFGAGVEKLTQAIDVLQQEPRAKHSGSSKYTALFDALAAAAELVPPGEEGVLIALTDGGDNRSQKQFPEVRTILLGKAIRLFSFTPFIETVTVEEALGLRKLLDLVEQTGGMTVELTGQVLSAYTHQASFYMSLDDLKKLDASAASMNAVIAHPYKLELRVAPEKPARLKLDVVDSAGKRRRNLQLHYPQEVRPCSVSIAR